MAPIIICIDGNIGVGKSTLLDELKNRGNTVIKEDVDTWGWCLNNYYNNQNRWAFTLQMVVMCSMASQYKTIQTMSDRLVFIERSPESGLIFSKNSYNNKHLNLQELSLLESAYQLFDWSPHIIVLLKASVEQCMQRIASRNRECEKSITTKYISNLNIEYDKIQAIVMDNYKNVHQLADDVEMMCNVL